VPVITVDGLPAEPLIGEQFCFTVNFENAGGPAGFGPYVLSVAAPGIDITSVDFVDVVPSLSFIGTFDASGELTDPVSGTLLAGEEGGTAGLARYPIGSLEAAKPGLPLNVCATLEASVEVGVPLALELIPGFEFGDTATGSNGAILGTPLDTTVTPQLARLSKQSTAPEGERPPGPSHPFAYRYTLNVSDQVTIAPVSLEDVLPAEVQWSGDPISVVSPLGTNCAVAGTPNPPPTPGGTVEVTCDAVVGTAGTADLSVSVPVYFADILDETLPDSEVVTNTVAASYDFDGTTYTPLASVDVRALHAALQKGVSGTAAPGNRLTYQLRFQVTDYPDSPPGAGADSFLVTDLLPDGLAFDGTLELTIDGAAVPISATVSPGPAPGETALAWDVALAAGGVVGNGASGTLTYSATVLDNYASGEPVRANDPLSNGADLTYTLTSGGSGGDDSGANANVLPNRPAKVLIDPSDPAAVVGPGDEVAFRLQLDIPAGNTAAVTLVDYLPQPIFDVADFDPATDYTVLPPFTALVPAVSVDSSSNSIRFDFGDVFPGAPSTLAVELRATVTDDPFADNLFLTNLSSWSYEDIVNNTLTGLNAAGLNAGAPVLGITKGVLAIDNPAASISPPSGGNPALELINGDGFDADAGDEVTYAITVENLGSKRAYNVVIDDPPIPGLSCAPLGPGSVRDGRGIPRRFSGDLETGITLFSAIPGFEDQLGAPFGLGTIIVTATCTLDSTVTAGEVLTNEAGVSWTSTPDSSIRFPRISDEASVEIAAPQVAKTLLGVAPGYSAQDRRAHVGELLSYRVEITVPEGVSPSVRLDDLLDAGLALVSVDSISASSPLSTSLGSFDDVLGNVAFSPSGGGATAADRLLLIGPGASDPGFGTIANSDTDNDSDEVISIEYTARALNAAINTSGATRRNRARWYWTPAGGSEQSVQARAPAVTIVEPTLQLRKELVPATGDSLTTPQVTLSLSHAGGSNADAFDVALSDLLPLDMQVLGPPDTSACATAPDFLQVAPDGAQDRLEASWDTFPLGGSCDITFTVGFVTNIDAGATITNCADVFWESLASADQPLPAPPANTLGVERTGDPAQPGEINDYSRQACDSFRAFGVGIEKRVTATSQAHTDGIPGTPVDGVSLTPGEEVTFELVVTVPETDVAQLIVTDILPDTEVVLELLAAGTTAVGADLNPAFADPLPLVSDGNGDGIDDTVELDFGAVAHTLDGVTDDRDRIRIEVLARVRDLPANRNNDVENNNAVARYPFLESSAELPVEVVESLLEIDKVAARDEAEAGDIIPYAVEIRHRFASRIDAKDVELTDQLPPELTLVPGSLRLSPACDRLPDTGPSPVGNGFQASWDTLPLAAACTVLFEAVVDVTAVTGEVFTNSSTVAWTSLDTVGDPDERSYAATDAWDLTISEPGLDKAITGTSIPGTLFQLDDPSTELTIGEEVTFTVTALFPDGTSNNVVVEDRLPTGDVRLRFLQTRIVAIGDDLTLGSGASVGDAAVACIPASDSCLRWVLGTVTNVPDARQRPADDPLDSVVFEVTAIVEDDPLNSGAPGEDKNLSNTALLTSDSSSLLATARFDLVEPVLELDKLTESGEQPGQIVAGGSHRFELAISHGGQSTAAALSLQVEDTLDPNLLWVDDSTVSSDCPGFTLVASPAAGSSGTVSFEVDSLQLRDRACRIGYSVQADPALPIPGDFPNTATLRWESAPGSPESRTGEVAAAAELVSFNDAAVRKLVAITSLGETRSAEGDPLRRDAAIGEVVEFAIVALFDEGTTANVVLTDILQADGAGELELLRGSVVFVGDNITASNPGNPVVAGNVVTLDLGDVTNTADGLTNRDDAIIFELVARVPDLPVNSDGGVLDNEVELAFDGGGPLLSAASVDVVEPSLVVGKRFTALENGVATLELTVQNTGTAPAFDLELTDEFDEAFWDPASFTPVTVPSAHELSAVSASGTTTVTLAVDGDPTASPAVLAPGDAITAVFTLALQNGGVLPVTAIANTATATVSSLPGPEPAERSYSESASDTLFLPALALRKSWSGPNDPALPGDTLSYLVELENTGQAPAEAVVINDTPDAIGEFQAGSVITSAGGSVLVGNAPGDTAIEVVFAQVDAGQTLTVSYDLRVSLPYPDGLTAPEQLVNQAAADSSSLPGLVSDDPATPDPNDPTVVPVAADPVMRVTKTPALPVTTPGALVSYTVTYGNAGDQDATGVVLTETVPDFTRFEAAASDPRWSCADGAGPGTPCELAVGALTVGTGSAVFAVRVDDVVPGGVDEISNTVDITDDGIEFDPAAPVVPSTDSATVVTPLGASPQVEVTKDDGGISVNPGQRYAYRIGYRNAGNQAATGVILTETVPDDTLFSAAASAPSVWSCADGSPPGTVCTLFVGLFPAAEPEREARFGLQVLFPARAGLELLFNEVLIEDDGNNSPQPRTDRDDDVTPLIALPDLVIDKRADVQIVDEGDTIIYTLAYSNVGDQDATGVVISDSVPGGTVFRAAGSDPRWSCADGQPAGDRCTLSLGLVPAGTGGEVVMSVEVVATPGERRIVNTALIVDDVSNGPDPTPQNNVSTVTTPFPALSIPALGRLATLLLVLSVLLLGLSRYRPGVRGHHV
jgi:uncharacterized repeat protein (TIGR01451 family)/fimbrial isopeptide formation D2 family protein